MGQYGLDRRSDGTGGTQPEDVQQIIAAQFVNADQSPMVGGGVVTGRADLRYAYSAGVGVMSLGQGRAIHVTWDAGTTAPVDTPAVDRVDVVWANEFGVFASPEGQVPGTATILDKRRLPGGATATSGAASVWDRRFALPYGASLGWLFLRRDSAARYAKIPKARHTWVSGRFFVPTDRHVSVKIDQALFCGPPGVWPPNPEQAGAMLYHVSVDGAPVHTAEVGADQIWDMRTRFVGPVPVKSGVHTLTVEREQTWGQQMENFGGGDRLPGFVGVFDEGVVQ